MSETPEFTTRSVYTIAMRGVVHVVENRQYVDPGTLVDKVVLLDGEPRKSDCVAALQLGDAPRIQGVSAYRVTGQGQAMTDEPERDCHLTCWCRTDDPDPAGGMRWEPETVPATRPDEQ